MKYKSCDLIEHGLDFAQDSINFCCRTTDKNGSFKRLIDNYHGELLDLEKFFAIKRKYRNTMKSGKCITLCKGCIYLQEKEYDDEDYISYINFNHGLTCNLKCIYCTLTHEEKTKEPEYDIYPVIKDIDEKGYLKKGGQITIAGGEPTLYKNFEKLIRLFIEKGITPVRVLTNGTRHLPIIEEGLEKNIVNLMISIDSGSPEMYKWIKGADFYDKVWENISKYLKYQMYPCMVQPKYIIIPEINDSKEEIMKFFDQCERYNTECAAFDIELNWYNENCKNIPKDLLNLTEFTLNEATKRRLNYFPVDRVVSIIEILKKEKGNITLFRSYDI